LRKVSSQIAPNKNTSGQLVDFRPALVGRGAGCRPMGRDIVRPNRYG